MASGHLLFCTLYLFTSSIACEKYLQILFTILYKSPHIDIRANTIIAISDLTFRFPNLLEPWSPRIYAWYIWLLFSTFISLSLLNFLISLRDSSPVVRKNTLTVLSHLILNDMIKVKGQISELVLCLEDKEPEISRMSQAFFHELSLKVVSLCRCSL